MEELQTDGQSPTRSVRRIALACAALLLSGWARAQTPGEALTPELLGPGVVETMDVVVQRDLAAGNQAAVFVPAPARLAAPFPSTSSTQPGGGASSSSILPPNPPLLSNNFIGPRQGDTGANSIPPDTHGSVGINHFVAIVNTNLSVYVKSTGQRVVNTSLSSFFGAGAGGAGDPRAVFDPISQRFILLCSDFSTKIFLAVSTTSDPTGAWFKTNFVASAGTDAGKFPDYPTLGVDLNGIYTCSYMVGNPATMSIFAINKAPLIAGVQSLGTVTAFRNLPYEDAIQPVVNWDAGGGAYFLSTRTSTQLRLRRVNPPLSAPTLSELGNFTVPSYGGPPTVAAPGGAQLDSLDGRLMQAMLRNGRIWTTHAVNSGGRSAVRWYELNPTGNATVQSGTVNDTVLGYTMPSICVNNAGAVLLGFTGASSTTNPSAYYVGRAASDPAGQMSTPLVLKAGEAPYTTNGTGVSRWGDYSNTSCDPVDGSLWTIQEYARTGNNWGNWIGRFAAACTGSPDCNGNGTLDSCDIQGGASLDLNNDSVPDECQGLNASVFCGTDGSDPFLTTLCPCFNFGGPGRGCSNSVEIDGGLLAISGLTNPESLAFTVSGLPPVSNMIFVKGTSSNNGGAVFGDGVRCVGGSQVRFGSQSAQAGFGFFPDLAGPTISAVSGTPPGSGLTAFYQVFYRNPDPTFCPSATFNMTNGVRIVW
ncbi:MAG: hypothetical protein NTY35_04635 [Planctomycetota bacterium]|nr:hypothetical protein [Planctomycetota bacterium]